MDLTIMVDHKLKDRGRRIGSTSMECLREISAMASRDKKKFYVLSDLIYVVVISIKKFNKVLRELEGFAKFRTLARSYRDLTSMK